MKKIVLFGALLVLLAGCNSIPYQDDVKYANSAQAGRFEFPVSINGKVCKDLDNELGACVKQIRSDESLVIDMPARPYSYMLKLTCSFPLGVNFPVSVEKDKAWHYEITPDVFAEFLVFSCVGEVTPDDRDNKLSAMWHSRVLVYDAAYQKRELIYSTTEKGKRYLVLGPYAKYSDICDANGCRSETKKTVVKYEGDVRAFTESEVMRFNSLGY